MIKLICFLSIIAYATSASVKREEYNPDPLLALTNQVNGNRDQSSVGSSNNSPVYSPNSYPTYSSSYGSPALSNSNQNVVSNNYGSQSDANANQAYVDNVASAASNLPSSQLNQPNYSNYPNQGNLYYYYYPVQDKNKDVNYQASPSNQYASSIVQPQNGEDQQNQNNANLANNQQGPSNSPNNPNHDLNYGAQDLAYTASALNENGGNSPGQQGNNYESQLTNLANAFAFGQGSGSNAFGNSQFASQLSGFNNMNFGEAFGGSSIQPSSVPFVNDQAFSAAMASQLGQFSPAAQAVASGSSSGGPLSQLYQQATQMYQGLINGATGNSGNSVPQFAASQQHASYEPSTGSGSSFRSKYGLGSVVLPLMALAGLSLLIPTVTSLSTVASRKKRSAEDNLNLQQAGLGAYLERIDRYYSLYKNAIEKEECMSRLVCELGDAVSGVKGKDAFFEFVERIMPNGWVNNKQGNSKISIFKSALSGDNAKCKKYKCYQ